MIQYIIAAGIGALLGWRSKKSKKSYADGGKTDDGGFNHNQKNSHISVYIPEEDEFYSVEEIRIEDEDDVLDAGHPYLVLGEPKVRYSDLYAKGGIMADGRLELGSSNGVGGNLHKTYKLIKDDRDSDGKPYYEVVERPSNFVMAQGDNFVEVNNMYKLFTGKQ